MAETTLNTNNNVYICSTSAKFLMLMYDIIRICIRKINEANLVLAYGKPFITELFEGPSYAVLE